MVVLLWLMLNDVVLIRGIWLCSTISGLFIFSDVNFIELCLNKDGLGYEVFNVGNDNNSVNISNDEIISRFYKNIKIKKELNDDEALFSNKKIKDVLGFKEQHNWKKYL